MKQKISVIVLNWNGKDDSLVCIDALKKQTLAHTTILVDNGSIDGLSNIIEKEFPDIILLKNSKNLGFAGGVNTGIRYALANNFDYVALLNNDAVPERDWLEKLYAQMHETTGIVTGKLLRDDGRIDSVGENYSIWGLAFPQGRDEKDTDQYDTARPVFAASGGASLYSLGMLRQIGLFDEDFFAYYEDVDLSFRARLAGWNIIYTPYAVAHHKVGATSSKVPGFTTYHTIKNLPWLLWKNVPTRLLLRIWPRFLLIHSGIVLSSILKGKFMPTFKGLIVAMALFPKKLIERSKIQRNIKISSVELAKLITYDLPPNALRLRKLMRRT